MTKCGPLEEGMANHSSILAKKNPINSIKNEKDMTLKDEHPPPTPKVRKFQICYWGKLEDNY